MKNVVLAVLAALTIAAAVGTAAAAPPNDTYFGLKWGHPADQRR